MAMTTLSHAQRGIEAGALIQPQIYGQFFQDAQEGRQFKIPYSFAIGINAGYNFSDFVGIRTGFIYSPQGDKYADTSSDPEDAYDINLDYIQVPLYLKYNSSATSKFAFLALVGGHASFLNNAAVTINEEDAVSILGDYNRLIFGASIGIGLQLNLDQGGNINFLWRTAASLNDVQKEGPFSKNFSTGLQLAYHYFINF
jgi:hypothetical protein